MTCPDTEVSKARPAEWEERKDRKDRKSCTRHPGRARIADALPGGWRLEGHPPATHPPTAAVGVGAGPWGGPPRPASPPPSALPPPPPPPPHPPPPASSPALPLRRTRSPAAARARPAPARRSPGPPRAGHRPRSARAARQLPLWAWTAAQAPGSRPRSGHGGRPPQPAGEVREAGIVKRRSRACSRRAPASQRSQPAPQGMLRVGDGRVSGGQSAPDIYSDAQH